MTLTAEYKEKSAFLKRAFNKVSIIGPKCTKGLQIVSWTIIVIRSLMLRKILGLTLDSKRIPFPVFVMDVDFEPEQCGV
ncbi:unnamed protein product, partial [Brenthis ino]